MVEIFNINLTQNEKRVKARFSIPLGNLKTRRSKLEVDHVFRDFYSFLFDSGVCLFF